MRPVPVDRGLRPDQYIGRGESGQTVHVITHVHVSPNAQVSFDHTCGLTIRDKVDHLDPKGQADLSRTKQINMAG